MDGTYYAINTTDSLYHYGVKGMKWGHRRYQNEDGSLTQAGREHYSNQAHYGSYEVKEGTTLYKQKKSKERKLTTAVTAGSAAINAAMGSPYVANAIAVSKAALATGNPVIIGSAAVGAAIGGIAAYKINQYTVSKPVLAAVDAAKRHLATKKLYPDDKQMRKATYDHTKFTRKRDKILSKAGYVQNEDGDVYTHKKTGTRLYSDSIMDGGFSDKDVKKAVKEVNRADARINRVNKKSDRYAKKYGFKLPKDPNPSVPKNQRQYSSSGNKKIEDKLYDHGYRPIEEGSSYFGKYSHTGHGYYVDSTDGDKYVKDYIKSANKTYKDENRWARKNYRK